MTGRSRGGSGCRGCRRTGGGGRWPPAAGRRWPPRARAGRSASSPQPSSRAGGAAGRRARRPAGMRTSAGRWRGSPRSSPRFGVEYTLAGMDRAAAPDRLERAGPGPAGRRARRGGDRHVAGGDLAGDKRTAADLGAWLVFEDESGQGLRPPKGRTWGRRGITPVVTVTGGSNKRVSLAALIVHPARPPAAADLPHAPAAAAATTAQRLHRDGLRPALLDAAHQQLGGPVVLVWDNLNTHASARDGRADRRPGLADRLPAPAVRARAQPGRDVVASVRAA